MHLMMHAKIGVHVRLGSVGIRLTALLIIHQSYTPLCHQLAPTHVAAAVYVRKLKHAHIEHTHTHKPSQHGMNIWMERMCVCMHPELPTEVMYEDSCDSIVWKMYGECESINLPMASCCLQVEGQFSCVRVCVFMTSE